ncbi:hypothetical protein [Brumimicrobium oceani]|uniref:Seryl-tRNA synthetase n=1 Tax=Brumimicrobium oceani TaxID=2100725 RepID=A0A2U2XA93_9FLAO|nr:hypothetical protein [Brumimicrobium oceani]PWH84670.1 hypothetical protein DIT68_13170 [Brumimicrobium oceani]
MKKTAITIFAAFSLLLVPNALNAQDNNTDTDKPLTERLMDKVVKQKTERSAELESRLVEIYEMDKSDMSFGEKRALRKEVREIEKTTTNGGGGIYISVGGLVLILILLIILL